MDDALRFFALPELTSASLVLAFEGWNDAGEAASAAVRFVQDATRGVPLAEIDCEEFFDFTVQRPRIAHEGNDARVMEWPTTRFSFGSLPDGRELVVGIGVEPHLRWRHFAELVCAFVRRTRIREVVLLGAYLADVVYSRPVDVTGFASTPGRLDTLGVGPSSYEGPTGIVGVLHERLRQEGVAIISLWAGLPHYISAAPNPRGALALVQKLSDCIGSRFDDTPLRRESAEFEERSSAIVAGDPELSDYVRELKKREFAQ